LSSVLLGSASGWFPTLSAGFKFISTIIPSLLALIVFALAYRILPYAPVSWRDAFIGAAFVAVAYEITKSRSVPDNRLNDECQPGPPGSRALRF
ncbi:MAG: hypothetical protein EBW95_04860, partial [Burkholderiaceae bacterium]|nr:hypothetical protein [Burkholderiaceae bacterium]